MDYTRLIAHAEYLDRCGRQTLADELRGVIAKAEAYDRGGWEFTGLASEWGER